MQLSNPSKLQTLFWEIKNRFFYILLSFFFTFVIAYQNSKSLLYIFVLSYNSNCKIIKIYNFLKKQEEDLIDKTGYLFSQPVSSFIISVAKQSFATETKKSFVQPVIRQGKQSENQPGELVAIEIGDGDNIDVTALLSLDTTSRDFIFTDLEEAFSNIVLVCLIFSCLTVIPLLIYEIFSFFSSSLYFHERKKWCFRLFAIISFWCIFVYTVQNFVIPKLAEFLLFFEIYSSAFSLSAETKISSYCSWVSKIWIAASFFFFANLWIFFALLSSLSAQSKTRDAFPLISCTKPVTNTASLLDLKVKKDKQSNYLPEFASIGYKSKQSKFKYWIFGAEQSAKQSFVKARENNCTQAKLCFANRFDWGKQRKIHIVISLLLSAFIAPPESIQIILAIFLFFSFEILIYFFTVLKHFNKI